QDWRGAAAEFRKLAIAYPDSSGFAFDAASAYMQAGDSATAMQWFREAARRPDAPAELLEAVRRMQPAPPAATPAPAAPAKKPKRHQKSPATRAHEPTDPGR